MVHKDLLDISAAVLRQARDMQELEATCRNSKGGSPKKKEKMCEKAGSDRRHLPLNLKQCKKIGGKRKCNVPKSSNVLPLEFLKTLHGKQTFLSRGSQILVLARS